MRAFLFAAAALLAAVPSVAHAHAILMSSQPAEGGSVAAGPTRLMLRYNSRIDHARSRLVLSGTNAQMTLPLDGDAAADVLSAPAELSPGSYVVHWQVLATDGHLTRGDLHFTVSPK